MNYIVLVEEGHSLQDLSHEPLHIFLTEGLILLVWHTLIENFSSSRTATEDTWRGTDQLQICWLALCNVSVSKYLTPFRPADPQTFQCVILGLAVGGNCSNPNYRLYACFIHKNPTRPSRNNPLSNLSVFWLVGGGGRNRPFTLLVITCYFIQSHTNKKGCNQNTNSQTYWTSTSNLNFFWPDVNSINSVQNIKWGQSGIDNGSP